MTFSSINRGSLMCQVCPFLLFALFFSGCAKSSRPKDLPNLKPCSCIIIQEGVPLEGAVVTLHAEEGEGKYTQSSGTTDARGEAKLRTYGFDGVPKGNHIVTVRKVAAEGGVERVDFTGVVSVSGRKEYSFVLKEFADKKTSPLKITVGDKKNTTETFDLGKPVKDFIGVTR